MPKIWAYTSGKNKKMNVSSVAVGCKVLLLPGKVNLCLFFFQINLIQRKIVSFTKKSAIFRTNKLVYAIESNKSDFNSALA